MAITTTEEMIKAKAEEALLIAMDDPASLTTTNCLLGVVLLVLLWLATQKSPEG